MLAEKEKAMDLAHMAMAQLMKETGKVEADVGLASTDSQTEPPMRESGTMTKCMGKENYM